MVEAVQFTIQCDGVNEATLFPDRKDGSTSKTTCGASCGQCPILETVVFSFAEIRQAGQDMGLTFEMVTHLTYADFDRSVRLLAMSKTNQMKPCERTGAKRYLDGMSYKIITTPTEETKK
jgi:hypothetical protein